MAHPNKLIGVAAAGLLALGAVGASHDASARPASNQGVNGSAADETPAYEQVDSFVMWNHPYSWSPVDDRTVVLWPTPFEAYLVRIVYPSHDLSYVQHIGVTSSTSRVYAKFDALQIRGFRYPIESIYKLTREEARNLTSRKPDGTQPKPPAVTEPKPEAENSAPG